MWQKVMRNKIYLVVFYPSTPVILSNVFRREVSADKRQRSIKKTRGGGGTARGVVTTSQQMRGKQEEICQQTRGSGILKAGGASRQ